MIEIQGVMKAHYRNIGSIILDIRRDIYIDNRKMKSGQVDEEGKRSLYRRDIIVENLAVRERRTA